MKARLKWATLLVAAAVGTTALAAGAAQARPAESAKLEQGNVVKVGVIYSRTGALAAYGAEFIQGLRLGLEYLGGKNNVIGGKKIELTVVDDAGDPAKAVAAARDMIGQGYKIITGTVSSGVALQVAPLAAQNRILYISGPAASDAITGLNRYTFRSGRQTYQDVKTAAEFLGKNVGRKVLVFAQDTVFGQGNFAAVNAIIGGKGHTVSRILVPFSATDFTPFARQARDANPDLLFVAWAGTTAAAMWRALDQQNVFTGTTVTTGLAERATWSTFGADVGTKIKFLSHYVYTAPKNRVNDWLVKKMRGRNQAPDLFTPDGFVAAQMIARATGPKGSSTDVEKMITALEGYQFLAPKGLQRIRPQDHAMTQPMFQVQLVQQGSRLVPRVLQTISPGNVQPPVKTFP